MCFRELVEGGISIEGKGSIPFFSNPPCVSCTSTQFTL